MISLDSAATEVFQILRSYDYTVMMYDDDGNQVYEPEGARRFFANPENLLVSIVDSGDNSSIRLYIGSSTDVADVMGLDQTLRATATKYNMLFNMKRFGRDLKPSDFSTRASVTERQEEPPMNILEGMYGTTRSSYLKLENARMIVRHSKKIDENIMGARGRHVDAIFVENAQGERFLFPTRQLSPARSMTQHVNHGGSFADAVGQQIIRMAQDYSNLAQASSFIGTNSVALGESALDIRESCRGKMRDMRKCFERLSRAGGYMNEAARLEEQANVLTENEDEDLPLDEVRSVLCTEGLELDETVLKSVAEAFANGKKYGGDDVSEDTMTPADKKHVKGVKDASFGKGFTSAVVHVLGRDLDVDAWDDLKAGKLDLIKPPVLDGEPQFLNKDAELSFKLNGIVPEVRDDTMLNFLSYVAERLQERNSPEVQKGLRAVAAAAIRASGLDLDAGVPVKQKAVREFAEWLAGFKTEQVLLEAENPYDPDSYAYGRASQAREDAAEQVANDFDPKDFLESNYSDWFWGDTELSDEERTVSKAYIIKMLASYLADKVEQEHDEIDVDMDSIAADLYSDVEAVMKSANYNITEGEGEELSREDALIPTDPSADLVDEVTCHDDDEVTRLRTLAGMHRR